MVVNLQHSSKPCDVQTYINCNFQETWVGRIFGGDWIKVVSFPLPALFSQPSVVNAPITSPSCSKRNEVSGETVREVWFHLWWHLLGSIHWNGRSLLQRFYRSTWLGFCQWGRKVGMALEKMDVVSFKRANFPSSLLFFLLVSFFLKSWKFQLTWLDVFECKFLPKKNVLIQRSPLNTRPRITSGILMGFLSTGLGDPQLLPKFS